MGFTVWGIRVYPSSREGARDRCDVVSGHYRRFSGIRGEGCWLGGLVTVIGERAPASQEDDRFRRNIRLRTKNNCPKLIKMEKNWGENTSRPTKVRSRRLYQIRQPHRTSYEEWKRGKVYKGAASPTVSLRFADGR